MQDLQRVKLLEKILPLLAPLREVGTERDTAGNRTLFFDQYLTLVLLFLFNPLLDSLRMLQQASALEALQKRLKIKRFSLGSFSESCRVFDPDKLKAIVEQLAGECLPVGRPELLKDLPGKLTLVDSTLIQTLVSVAEAMFMPHANGPYRHAWRLHLQLDVDHHVPGRWELTPPKNTGKSDEKNVLRATLQAGHLYVMDRWYSQFTLWNDIVAAGSGYVCRVRDNSSYAVLEERSLSEQDKQAGVLSDQIVQIGLSKKKAQQADHKTRLIRLACTPHQKRGKSHKKGNGQTGPTSDGILRIVTNNLDAPAHVIAFLYQYRWMLEVFFRFLKQLLGCRHLLSGKPEGVQIQIYAAVIACMLLNQLTGKKPAKRHVVLVGLYLQGVATEAEVLAELNKPDRTGEKLRQQQQRKDALWKYWGL